MGPGRGLTASRASRLREALDALVERTDVPSRIPHDPIAFPRRYGDPRDAEVAAVLAAFLAFGRVASFTAVLERLFAALDPSPAAFVRAFDPAARPAGLAGIGHRWTRPDDIAALLWILRVLLERHGSLGAFAASCQRPEDDDTGPLLERFVAEVRAIDTSPVYGRARWTRGLGHFFARPSAGSACKRLSLLLRWLVRPEDGLDLGLWRRVPPAKLVVPLDTHVLRIGRYLGLTRRRTGGWAAALDITRAFRRLSGADPLRYDFPLCHWGISGACPTGRDAAKCRACPLVGVCAKGRVLARRGPAA